MANVRLTCPECDKVFKASGEPSPGKKVKCPACKHAFVPTPDEDEDESDGEDEPRPKAKTSAKKNSADRPQKRRRDEDDEEEDDDNEEDDVPVKKKKKKKKSNAGAVLYWVYRGVSVLVLLVLLGVLAWVLLNPRRAALNDESVIPVAPFETQYKITNPVSKIQEVNISAKAISGQFDIYVYMEKDKAEAEEAIIGRKKTAKIVFSKLNTNEAERKVSVPANESAAIRLTSGDGKKAEVKLKLTN